ncbi:MAG: DUF374 domain-containing protein [Planctomycetes bacterium]|nr:DUF374 domain-containing protein [Planctomycetota bacterium]
MPVLRDELRFRLAGWAAAGLVKGLYATWRVEVVDPLGTDARIREGAQRCILTFWHRQILIMLAHSPGLNLCVPVSEHRDGEYVAQVMDRFGVQSLRGSSTRGGLGLLKGLLRKLEEGAMLGITPDGPRGPRFEAQRGVAMLARKCGASVFPVGAAASHALVFPSWDRFLIPKPWSRVALAYGRPLNYDDYGDDQAFCDALGAALRRADRTAGETISRVR